MTEFNKYLKEARQEFCKEVNKYTVSDNLQLRTACDSFLIAFDQATEQAINYTRCCDKLKDRNDELSELSKDLIRKVEKKIPYISLPEDEKLYTSLHKLKNEAYKSL